MKYNDFDFIDKKLAPSEICRTLSWYPSQKMFGLTFEYLLYDLHKKIVPECSADLAIVLTPPAHQPVHHQSNDLLLTTFGHSTSNNLIYNKHLRYDIIITNTKTNRVVKCLQII